MPQPYHTGEGRGSRHRSSRSPCRNQGAVHATACKGVGCRVRCTPQAAKVQQAGCGARVKGAGSRVRCTGWGCGARVEGAKVQQAGCGARVEGAASRNHGAVHAMHGAESGLLADQLHWPSRERITPALCFVFSINCGSCIFENTLIRNRRSVPEKRHTSQAGA